MPSPLVFITSILGVLGISAHSMDGDVSLVNLLKASRRSCQPAIPVPARASEGGTTGWRGYGSSDAYSPTIHRNVSKCGTDPCYDPFLLSLLLFEVIIGVRCGGFSRT